MLDKCGMSAEAIRRALEFVAVAEWICIVMAITLGVPALRAPGCPRCIFGCKFVPVLSRLWLTEISYGRTLQLHKDSDLATEYFRYINVTTELDADQISLYRDFLDRHNLWNQFIKEDIAGMR